MAHNVNSVPNGHRMPIWVQLWDLPLEYQIPTVATRLAENAGLQVITVDWADVIPRNITFMRVQVLIDRLEPLVAGTFMQQDDGVVIWVEFRYETNSQVCLTCGIIGHTHPNCPHNKWEIEEMITERLNRVDERLGELRFDQRNLLYTPNIRAFRNGESSRSTKNVLYVEHNNRRANHNGDQSRIRSFRIEDELNGNSTRIIFDRNTGAYITIDQPPLDLGFMMDRFPLPVVDLRGLIRQPQPPLAEEEQDPVIVIDPEIGNNIDHDGGGGGSQQPGQGLFNNSLAELTNKPTFKVYCKANPNLFLTIRNGWVILAPADPSNQFQHWYKDDKFGTMVKDEKGFTSFALVNKVTGQALKHSVEPTKPVQLIAYNANDVDESILWSQGEDRGDDGYKRIRKDARCYGASIS
ncbi:hypothetical protein COLO4_05925 [Corchorus olitorius]|uniref:Zinc knuckle CX2CX4HX4C domain-containing protein n=1 Tax=Corchorus olitorius TaxID=93759 RepID=A0A1R3KPG8_9ROSI|nr:hypothetical protein COLO4_05925 [Corchorus olitorius]